MCPYFISGQFPLFITEYRSIEREHWPEIDSGTPYFLNQIFLYDWKMTGKFRRFYQLNLACNKNYLYKTLYYWFRDMLNIDFLEKGLVIVSPPYFVHDFLRKVFLIIYSISWPNFRGSIIPELQSQIPKPSYVLWRHKPSF